MLKNPKLGWKVATGPMTGAMYRISGRARLMWPEKTVNQLPRMHQIRELLTHIGLSVWFWPIRFFTSNPRWISSNTSW